MRGTILIVTEPSGHVAATTADFEQQKPAGFTLEEAQEARCKMRIMDIIVRNHCSGLMADALCDNYLLDRLKGRLREKGWQFQAQRIDTDHQ